jgi:hypothetical protein
MTSVRKTALAVAVSTAMAAMVASAPASAVNISADGIGQVGLIPYYTVRNGFDTNISVVNTSSEWVVAFKIRFREADNSRDVRDFNVFLSPNDVWTARVSLREKADKSSWVPVLTTTDSSCTAPEFKARTVDGLVLEAGEVEFTSADYDGRTQAGQDGGFTGIERTYDGHVEVLSMGKASPRAGIGQMAMHPNPRCYLINNLYVDSLAQFTRDFSSPGNYLKVSANLVSTDDGVSVDVPVEMLSNFYVSPTTESDVMEPPSSPRPNLAMVSPSISYQLDSDGKYLPVEFDKSIDAVSSLFSATNVIGEYEGGNGTSTDWVVTFPTKQFYVDRNITASTPSPFKNKFTGSACDPVTYTFYDREEETAQDVAPVLPSPVIPTQVRESSLCYESQHVYFGSPVLDSVTGNNPARQSNLYNASEQSYAGGGWLNLAFSEPGKISGRLIKLRPDGSLKKNRNGYQYGSDVDFFGLPVISFSVVRHEGSSGAFATSVGNSYIRQIR